MKKHLINFIVHQKSRRLAVWQIIQKDRVLLAGDQKGQRCPSQVSKGQSLLVAMKWRKKAVKDFLLGKLSFARAFRNGIERGRGDMPSHNRSLQRIFFVKTRANFYCVRTWLQVLGQFRRLFFYAFTALFLLGKRCAN